mgnify:CR=1 FL=1
MYVLVISVGRPSQWNKISSIFYLTLALYNPVPSNIIKLSTMKKPITSPFAFFTPKDRDSVILLNWIIRWKGKRKYNVKSQARCAKNVISLLQKRRWSSDFNHATTNYKDSFSNRKGKTHTHTHEMLNNLHFWRNLQGDLSLHLKYRACCLNNSKN